MDKNIKEMKVKDRLDLLYKCFTNDGWIEEDQEERLTIEDLVTTEDLQPLLPKVIRRIIIEAVEPNQVIVPNLFTKLNLDSGQVVEIGALGSITAGKIAQGQEYPKKTVTTDFVGSGVAVQVSKYGCALHISKEAMEENQFDVIALWLKAAGAALARCKEAQAMKLINTMGYTGFDNAAPANSELGVLTGRNIAGAQNGTMTMTDLFEMWAWLSLRGFNPDTLIMSPLAWKTFITDPEMREIVFKGGTIAGNRMPLGSTNPGWQDPFKGLGLISKGTGPTNTGFGGTPSPWVKTINPLNATLNIPPRYLPTPLKILVTHLAPISIRTQQKPLCDIALVDSQRAGILVQKQQPTTEEADIFSNDTHEIHIMEKYGMNMFDQGKGCIVARNVLIDKNYVFENVNQQTLTALNNWTTLSV